MSLIRVQNLTFQYPTSYENIFENTSFEIDTDWKLGFIGRNGRGKTTFLNLLLNRFPYSGSITAHVDFDYFPFPVADAGKPALAVVKQAIAPFEEWEQEMERLLEEGSDQALMRYGDIQQLYQAHDGYLIEDLIKRETGRLQVSPGTLERPFHTLSNGEQTKVLISALFLKKNNFLLIDEPTNHLDLYGRKTLADYLNTKKGFLLVSHDRAFLDAIVDHVLSINRTGIEVQKGNYSTWQVNKERQEQFERMQSRKLQGEIAGLAEAANRAAAASARMVRGEGGIVDRDQIGRKSAQVMHKAKVMEARASRRLEEKTQLLQNVEQTAPLKLHPLKYHSKKLIDVNRLAVSYGGTPLFPPLTLTVSAGERIALRGRNGCGKSTLLKLLLGEGLPYSGTLQVGSGLVFSYVSQDTSFLKGGFSGFAQSEGIDESLFKAILRKLDFSRSLFDRQLEQLSGGQKKKVLLAGSLARQAHLYLWDEPLNYVDVLSRVQIEELIQTACPTMLFVEHDQRFCEKVATRTVFLDGQDS